MLRLQSHAHGRWSRIGAGVGGRRLTGGASEAPHRERKKKGLAKPHLAVCPCATLSAWQEKGVDGLVSTRQSSRKIPSLGLVDLLVVEKSMCFVEEVFYMGADDEYKTAVDPLFRSVYAFGIPRAKQTHSIPSYIRISSYKMRSAALLTALLAGQAFAYPKPVIQSTSKRGWPSINAFLTEIAKIMPIGDTITAACDLIGDGEDIAADLFGIDNTENEACGDVTVVFARGTCDPGNVGVLVGPFFFNSLQNALGSTSLGVQGFDYPASVQGFLSGAVQPGIDL